MAKRRVFDQQFEDEALRVIATSGKSVVQIANDLGINPNTLYH